MNAKIFLYALLAFLVLFACKDDELDLSQYPDAVVNNDPPGAPSRGIISNWENHTDTLRRRFFDQNVGVYFAKDVSSDIEWPFTYGSSLWDFAKNSIGTFGANDGKLYLAVRNGGTQPFYSTYFNDDTYNLNLIDFSAQGNEITQAEKDLLAKMVSQIVEEANNSASGSPANALWGDSWIDIFSYSYYKNSDNEADAMRIHDAANTKFSSIPNAETYWYRDWMKVLYDQYNGMVVFKNFFRVLAENYPKDGFTYIRDLNIGELVHFFSGATGEDLQPLAETAFGWNIDLELELRQARFDFPDVDYPFEPVSQTVDITGMATLTVSHENPGGPNAGEGSRKLIDGDYGSKFLIFDYSSNMGFWMEQAFSTPQVVKKYSITSGNDAPGRDPKKWRLLGSNDRETWVELDLKQDMVFEGRNQTKQFSFDNSEAYQFIRWYVDDNSGDWIFQCSEWRLFVIELIQPGETDFTSQATITVSHENPGGPDSGEGSKKIIDNDTNTKFLIFDYSPAINFWMQQDVGEQIQLKKYTLTSANDAESRDPKKWELQGSNNGTDWVVLDTRSDESFANRFETRTFEVDITEEYQHYRINVQENHGDGLFQLAEWRLFGF